MLRCGIDASIRDRRNLTVSTVAYGMSGAKKANRAWTAAMNGRTFHMNDLNARKGAFKGVKDDDVDRIMRATIGAICQHAQLVVAVSCDLNSVEGHLPTTSARDETSRNLLSSHRSAYGLMTHLCMAAIGKGAKGKRDVSYVFEAGDQGQRGVLSYLEWIEQSGTAEQLRDLYSFAWKSVGTKDEIPGIFHSSELVRS